MWRAIRARRVAVALLLLAVPPAFARSGRAAAPAPFADGPFAVRYGIPAGTDLAALVDKPRLVAMNVETSRDPETGDTLLAGFGEAHAVFPLPLQAIAALLDDPVRHKTGQPAIREVRLELREASRSICYEDIGISFLGLEFGARTRSEIFREELPGGALGYRARLIECVEGNVAASRSSWYLEPVVVDGRDCTYVRIFSNPRLRNPVPGTAAIVTLFTPGQLFSMLERTAKAVFATLARSP